MHRTQLAVNRLATNLAELRDVPQQRALELDEDLRTLRDQMQRAENFAGSHETLLRENEILRERLKAALEWGSNDGDPTSSDGQKNYSSVSPTQYDEPIRTEKQLVAQHRADLLEFCRRLTQKEAEVKQLHQYISTLELRNANTEIDVVMKMKATLSHLEGSVNRLQQELDTNQTMLVTRDASIIELNQKISRLYSQLNDERRSQKTEKKEYQAEDAVVVSQKAQAPRTALCETNTPSSAWSLSATRMPHAHRARQ